jgi:hypothetical protein
LQAQTASASVAAQPTPTQARPPAEPIRERRVKNDHSYTSGALPATAALPKLVPIRPDGAPSAAMLGRRHPFVPRDAHGGGAILCDRPGSVEFRPLFFVLLGSCLQFGLPDGKDGGVSDAARDSGATSDTQVSERDAAGDSGCIVDPLSRVTLCTAIALCPGLAVDHDRFPNCGFRTGAGIIELQCLCHDFLCPLGATLTCGQARDLLASQFELNACLQVSEGRCAPRSAVPPTGSSCDKNCAAMCGGDAACIRRCGC